MIKRFIRLVHLTILYKKCKYDLKMVQHYNEQHKKNSRKFLEVNRKLREGDDDT